MPRKAQLHSSPLAVGACSLRTWITKRSGPPEPLFPCLHSVLWPQETELWRLHQWAFLSFGLHLGWPMRSRILEEGRKGRSWERFPGRLPAWLSWIPFSWLFLSCRPPPHNLLPGLASTPSLHSINPKGGCGALPSLTPFPAASLHAVHNTVNNPVIIIFSNHCIWAMPSLSWQDPR